MPPWRAVMSGVELRVRLTPRASRDAIEGRAEMGAGPVLKVRVRAVPEQGKANLALAKLIAAQLRVPVNAVAVIGSAKSRIKTLRISGDAGELVQRLQAQLSDNV